MLRSIPAFRTDFSGVHLLGRCKAGKPISTVVLLAAGTLLDVISAQALPPIAGSKPAVAVSGFEPPTRLDASFPLVEKALTGASLSIGGTGTSERYGQNAHVTVVVTCAQLSSGQSRIEVIAASTDPVTANFYRGDIKAHLQEKDPSRTPPGEAVPPPNGGTAPNAQFGGFEPLEYGLRLDAADKSLIAKGLTVTTRASGQHTGVNAHVAVVVTWAILHPQSPPSPPDADGNSGLNYPDEVDRFVIIALSTDSGTAEYYRNSVRNVLNPPPPPVYLR